MKIETKSAMRTKSIRLRNAGRRGTAMVEGAIVFVPLAVLLCWITFVAGARITQLRQQDQMRRTTFLNAINGCEAGANPHIAEATSNKQFNVLAVGPANASPPVIDPGSLSLRAFSVESVADRYTMGNITAPNGAHLKSYVYCNEKPHDGTIGGFADFVGDTFSLGKDFVDQNVKK